jgi:lipopolysaccharide transport system permease protein
MAVAVELGLSSRLSGSTTQPCCPETLAMPQSDAALARPWQADPAAEERRPEFVIRPPGSITAGLLPHLAHLPAYWSLLLTLTVHRIKVRYKQSALGLLWAILQPLLLMLIFTVLFALTAPRMPSEGLPYSVFVYAAVLPWTFFSTAVSNGTNSLVSHTQLVTKIWFPREILPFSYITAALFDFLVASTLLVGLMLYHGVEPARYIFLAMPIVGLIAAILIPRDTAESRKGSSEVDEDGA